MRVKHRWILLYDISDTKRLNKVAKIAEAYGTRVQKSVFEMYADDFTINNIEKRIQMVITEDDTYAIIPVCIKDWEKTIRYGIIEKDYEDPLGEEEIFL